LAERRLYSDDVLLNKIAKRLNHWQHDIWLAFENVTAHPDNPKNPRLGGLSPVSLWTGASMLQEMGFVEQQILLAKSEG